VFFLPTAFTFFYGFLLKTQMVLGIDFGPLGFRFYQFLFVLLVPVVSTFALRRMFPADHGARFLLLLVILSVTHFAQTAATVRPEVLGTVIFVLFLGLRERKSIRGYIPPFVLALSGIVHPIFTLLAVAVFGAMLLRKYQQHRFADIRDSVRSLIAFAIPFSAIAIYLVVNFGEFQRQTTDRAGFLATDAWTAPAVIWNSLVFWDDPAGIEFGLFSGYPAVAFVLVMLASTGLVIYRRSAIWGHERHWLALPLVTVQWFVFLFLPAFLPYLAFSSILAGLIIVLLWEPPRPRVPNKNIQVAIAGIGFALCLIFITFQVGKSLVAPEVRLTPSGLHSVMSPALSDPETKLYTDRARLIPPLLDHFSDDRSIRLNFVYLSPDCLQPHLLERANAHTVSTLANADSGTTYWGVDRNVAQRGSKQRDDGTLSFIAKGSHSLITLTPSEEIYSDNKNLITRASFVMVEINEQACLDK